MLVTKDGRHYTGRRIFADGGLVTIVEPRVYDYSERRWCEVCMHGRAVLRLALPLADVKHIATVCSPSGAPGAGDDERG